MSVNVFEAALNESDHLQASFELKEEVKHVSETVKFANSRLYELEKLNTAMFDTLTELIDLTSVNQEESEASRKSGKRSV